MYRGGVFGIVYRGKRKVLMRWQLSGTTVTEDGVESSQERKGCPLQRPPLEPMRFERVARADTAVLH